MNNQWTARVIPQPEQFSEVLEKIQQAGFKHVLDVTHGKTPFISFSIESKNRFALQSVFDSIMNEMFGTNCGLEVIRMSITINEAMRKRPDTWFPDRSQPDAVNHLLSETVQSVINDCGAKQLTIRKHGRWLEIEATTTGLILTKEYLERLAENLLVGVPRFGLGFVAAFSSWLYLRFRDANGQDWMRAYAGDPNPDEWFKFPCRRKSGPNLCVAFTPHRDFVKELKPNLDELRKWMTENVKVPWVLNCE